MLRAFPAALPLLALVLALPPSGAAGSGTTPLERRMEGFLAAARRSDVEGVVPFFPRRGSFTYLHTSYERDGAHPSTWIFPAADARKAITDGPLQPSFEIQAEGQTIGLFTHQLILRGTAWRRVRGTRFVPPGANASSGIFVEWRREGSEWVISAFGDESYHREPLPAGAAEPDFG